MTEPKERSPLESYSAALFNLLIEGSRRRFEVQTTYRKAVALRLRCHRLREQMRKSGHPMFSALARTRITIEWPPDVPTFTNKRGVRWPKDQSTTVTMSFGPHDSQFSDIIKQIEAGGVDLNRPVDLGSAAQPATEGRGGSTTEPCTEPYSLEDLLKDLK